MTAARPSYNPARALAVRVLTHVLMGEGFAAPTLDAALTEARLPARDAGLATHIVYGTLRYLARLDAALAPLLRGETHPKARALLLAGTFERLALGTPPHAVVSEYVNVARMARLAPPALVNAVLRRVELPPETEETRYALPTWLIGLFRAAYGERAEATMLDLLEPQPLWLSLSDEGVRELEAEGSVVDSGPQGVDRVTLARPLRESRAYRGGRPSPLTPRAWRWWTRWVRWRVCACWTWQAAQA